MIKHVFVFQPTVNWIEADRYYFRYHSKEVVRATGPWLRRYETYRAVAAPDGENFGLRDRRLTELWYSSVEEWKEAAPYSRAYTAPAGGWEAFFGKNAAVTIVPAMPTEDFLGHEPAPEERPILRWFQVFRYPDGISAAAGDRWYLDTHAPEMKRQPGLLRYVSHRKVPDAPFPTPWHRVAELWYEDVAAWREAMKVAVRCTAPPWGGSFPFVPMVSIFVRNKPEVDFLRDSRVIP